jgi:hypothetical protein
MSEGTEVCNCKCLLSLSLPNCRIAMYRFDPEHYLNSPKLLLAQHRRRPPRRLHFII